MDMKQVIYDELCRVAKANNEIAYYSELARLAGLDMSSVVDRNRLSDILGEINTEEDGAGRPMLSAVALLKAENRPGVGFWNIAEHLGHYSGGKDEDAQYKFWSLELKKVYAYWKAQPSTP